MNAFTLSRKRLLAPIFGLALVALTPVTQAATAESFATIDWSTLTIATSGPLLIVPMDGTDKLFNAAALFDNDQNLVALDTSTTGPASVSGFGLTGATASGSLIAGPYAGALSDDGGLAMAVSTDSQTYAVYGNGAIAFSVNYSLGNEKSGADGAAFALTRLRALYYSNINTAPTEGIDEASDFLSAAELGISGSSGILSLVLSIGADGPDSFLVLRGVSFAAAKVSAVPLPASLPMLISAIAGFLALRSRSRNAVDAAV